MRAPEKHMHFPPGAPRTSLRAPQLAVFAFEVARRVENRNAFEFANYAEVGVTGNQATGFAGMGSVEKLVVLRITADPEQPSRNNDFAFANQNGRCSFARLRRNVTVELLAGDDLEQLVPGWGGKNLCRMVGQMVEKSAGYGFREEDAADEGVGVDNYPFSGSHRPCAWASPESGPYGAPGCRWLRSPL